MGAYCTLDYIRRHPAGVGEIMEVRRVSPYYYAAMFGDRGEIACIPHKGCLLEIVAAGEATRTAPLPEEDAIVQRATRGKPGVADADADTAAATRR